MPTLPFNFGNRISVYQRQEVTTLSPGRLIEKLYNLGIRGCNEKDSSKVSNVLTELISSLDFTHKEIALGLYRLYEYCLKMAKSGKFNEVSRIFKELVETWKQALNQMNP